MSAINLLVQSKAVHMMTDGASYLDDGTLVEVDAVKSHRIGSMLACLAATGPADLGAHMATLLEEEFASFDRIATAGSRINELFDDYIDEYREGDGASTVCLIGWDTRKNAPGAYAIELVKGERQAAFIARNNQHVSYQPAYSKLAPLTIMTMPNPPLETFAASSLEVIHRTNNQMDAELDLLHVLEIQRRLRFDGAHYVGGHAHLTTITGNAIDQRVVHRWQEDVVDGRIHPQPIDWPSWRAKRKGVALSGLSRLRRERMQKKLRKGKALP